VQVYWSISDKRWIRLGNSRARGTIAIGGRLAAEFAHQIKNPLAIINNAAFSLQRALRDGKLIHPSRSASQEEVEARIGSLLKSWLCPIRRGKGGKVNVIEELDRAITEVFRRQRNIRSKSTVITRGVPALLMQRRHAAERF